MTSRACIVLLFTLFILGQSNASAVTPDGAVLRVRLCADSGIDGAIVPGARLVVDRLLSAAGVTTVWDVCQRTLCPTVSSPVPEVVAILQSRTRRLEERSACGLAARTGHGLGSVIVSVPCVARVAFDLSRSSAARRHPSLAMPRHDDLVGAVIAHEIAHILGVGHAPSGVMRSDLQTADLLALRAGALTFDRHEVARLQHELAKANRPGAALDDTLVVRGAAQVRLPASTKAR